MDYDQRDEIAFGDDDGISPDVIDFMIARGICHVVADPLTGKETLEFTAEARKVAHKFGREVNDVRLVWVSQDVLDRYYPALEPDDKGVLGVLGINPEDDEIVVYLHPQAIWQYVKMRLVWEGVLWPDGGDTWDGEAVMDLYDDRETVGEDWRGRAWARVLGEIVRRRDADGREWDMLADKPSTELSPLSRFFRKNFWPWDVAALIRLIRTAWPDKDGALRAGAGELRDLADHLVAETFQGEAKYEAALSDFRCPRPEDDR